MAQMNHSVWHLMRANATTSQLFRLYIADYIHLGR